MSALRSLSRAPLGDHRGNDVAATRQRLRSEVPFPIPQLGEPMGTLNLQEAAHFLRVHPEELRRRAKIGQIPGAKVGRAWVFLEEDLAAYLRSLYPQPRQALQVTLRKEITCHFANAAGSGGSMFSLPTGSAYDELLGLPTKP